MKITNIKDLKRTEQEIKIKEKIENFHFSKSLKRNKSEYKSLKNALDIENFEIFNQRELEKQEIKKEQINYVKYFKKFNIIPKAECTISENEFSKLFLINQINNGENQSRKSTMDSEYDGAEYQVRDKIKINTFISKKENSAIIIDNESYKKNEKKN